MCCFIRCRTMPVVFQKFLLNFEAVYTEAHGGTLQLKVRGAGSIVWGLGFWLGKDILGFIKNIDLDNS